MGNTRNIMAEMLIAAGGLTRGPGGEIDDAQAALEHAREIGDDAAAEAADARIEAVLQEAREARAVEVREAGEMMRFASGARQPIKRRLPPNVQMDQTLLKLTGRIR